jgi:hypothetical protein
MTYFAVNCVRGYVLLSLIIFWCTGYVYRVNSKRKADDPEKRDFHPIAIPLSLIWPILLLIMVSLFILRALAYGVFLILFTIAMVLIRKPFLVKLLLKAETKIGTMFLKVNTFLIRAFFPQAKPNGIK